MVLVVSPGNICWRHRSANGHNQNERPTRVLHKPDKLISYRHDEFAPGRRHNPAIMRRNGLEEAIMIKRFHVLYVGQIALDNVGVSGTPADERRYSSERLSEVFASIAH